MDKPTLPARFTLHFEFNPGESRYVVTGDVLDALFPDEEFGEEDLYSTFEALADAFGDIECDEDLEDLEDE